MTAPKDLQVAQTVQQMAAYGYFKEEFLFYCYAFQRGEQIVYKFSEDAYSIRKSYQQCVFDDLYPTPIHSLLRNTIVPSGERQIFKTKYKLELIQTMRDLYGEPFFEAVSLFQKTSATDSARELLETYMHTLVPQSEKRQLYNGFCQQALEAKLLSPACYQQLMSSADRIYGKLDPVLRPVQGVGKLLSGFAYWHDLNADPKYYFSATIEDTYHRYITLRQQDITCSPIIQKRFLCSANEFKAVREQFQAEVHSLIVDCQVAVFLQQLKTLPPAVNAAHYQIYFDKLQLTATPEACKAYQSYGYRFHLNVP